MTRVVYDRAARDDLQAIATRIQADRPHVAGQVIARLRAACQRVGTYPHLGRAVPALGGCIHVLNERGGFVIVYEVGDLIIIHRVLGRGMDVGQAFA